MVKKYQWTLVPLVALAMVLGVTKAAAANALPSTMGTTVGPLASTGCNGHYDDNNPPASIRVLITATGSIVTVPFEQYVKDVLPNEWIASWSAAALQAGAMAAKTYAWYWTNHSGDRTSGGQCFDVYDSTSSQVYKAGSHQPSTDAAVDATWPVSMHRGGAIFESQYRANLTGNNGEGCGAGADGSKMSQYGSQACAVAGYSYQRILTTYYSGITLSTGGGRPHYTTTLGVYRGLSSTFIFSNSTTNGHTDGTLVFGAQGDIPVTGDWNADGFTTVGTFRPSTSTFYFDNSNITGNTDGSLAFGQFGDIPVTGDWDCDGSTTVGVYRPSTSTFYFDNSNITSRIDGSLTFGQKGDVPITGDWDGDGCTTVGVYRPSNSTFYFDNSNITAHTDGSITFGATGDVPVTGDWNADGYTTIGVYRQTTGVYYLCNSNITPHTDITTAFGQQNDTPITGAWNH
ncbi:hypothetical protein GCM10009765_43250 [Fodinicola feengrottensis]|uniref:Sporulation stage II protein D amidase enhancer LytB N-terminal domain-containing protein n=1 Tax=Fodinicola feengrottensis TaxID=435914 RepID=A0ABP4TK44_9ACTN